MPLLLMLACAPAMLRIPGPLDGLGAVVPEGTPPVAALAPAPPSATPDAASRVVDTARRFVGASELVSGGKTWRWDCSGLVTAALAGAGGHWGGSSADLFQAARDGGVLHHHRLPHPGDVAFFDDTYDRDGDGRVNDPLSHSGVVEAIAADGTVTLIHLGSKGVVRIHFNLLHPDEPRSPAGERWNDNLRAPSQGDGPRTRYLAAELWVGFGSLWKLVYRPTS